jgi:ribosomal subunit interface protein
MPMQTEITFKGIDSSEALRANIEESANKLDQFAADIMKCAVVLAPSEHRRHQGNRYAVTIHLTLPGGELNVSNTPTDGRGHEDAYVAIRDAFNAMRRMLKDYQDKQQGKVKRHE